MVRKTKWARNPGKGALGRPWGRKIILDASLTGTLVRRRIRVYNAFATAQTAVKKGACRCRRPEHYHAVDF